jgi:hypothetical protein
LFAVSASSFAAPATQPFVFDLGDRHVTLTKLDDLSVGESEYSRRFKFDSSDNPKLKTLRDRFHLEAVVHDGKDEFDRQILLLDWVNRQFPRFGKPDSPARGALDILQAVDEGHTFFCSHYADVFVSAAASLGWIDRPLALRRPDHIGSGSTEHTSTEIWSNQYRKWIMLDPTFAMYIEKDGVPLSAWEFREEWFRHDGKDLTFVLGKDRKRFHKSDLPVFRKTFPGFGDLKLDGGALNVYAFIGYIPNTNLMDAGPDYGKMFITHDEIGGATKWHKRDNPKYPASDPYFPINQAQITLGRETNHLRVSLKTMTPNFKQFERRMDGGDWQKVDGDSISWSPHEGKNVLEVRSVNAFDVAGPTSTIEVESTRVGGGK